MGMTFSGEKLSVCWFLYQEKCYQKCIDANQNLRQNTFFVPNVQYDWLLALCYRQLKDYDKMVHWFVMSTHIGYVERTNDKRYDNEYDGGLILLHKYEFNSRWEPMNDWLLETKNVDKTLSYFINTQVTDQLEFDAFVRHPLSAAWNIGKKCLDLANQTNDRDLKCKNYNNYINLSLRTKCPCNSSNVTAIIQSPCEKFEPVLKLCLRDNEYNLILEILGSRCCRRFYHLLRTRMYVELKRYQDAKDELLSFELVGYKNQYEFNEAEQLRKRIDKETNTKSLSETFDDMPPAPGFPL